MCVCVCVCVLSLNRCSLILRHLETAGNENHHGIVKQQDEECSGSSFVINNLRWRRNRERVKSIGVMIRGEAERYFLSSGGNFLGAEIQDETKEKGRKKATRGR